MTALLRFGDFEKVRLHDQSDGPLLLRFPSERGQHPHADALHLSENEEPLHVSDACRPARSGARVQEHAAGIHALLHG